MIKETCSQLSTEERDKIVYPGAQGKSISGIVKTIRSYKSTFPRELRGSKSLVYTFYSANRLLELLSASSGPSLTLTSYPRHLLLSITYDNDRQNVEYGFNSKLLETKSYLRKSFQIFKKASIEKRRRFDQTLFPKKAVFALVFKEQV